MLVLTVYRPYQAAMSVQIGGTWRLDMADKLPGRASGRQVIVGLAAM